MGIEKLELGCDVVVDVKMQFEVAAVMTVTMFSMGMCKVTAIGKYWAEVRVGVADDVTVNVGH